jgi:hypothetical protein
MSLLMMDSLTLSTKLVWDFVLKRQQMISRLQEKHRTSIVRLHIENIFRQVKKDGLPRKSPQLNSKKRENRR